MIEKELAFQREQLAQEERRLVAVQQEHLRLKEQVLVRRGAVMVLEKMLAQSAPDEQKPPAEEGVESDGGQLHLRDTGLRQAVPAVDG